MIQLTGKAKQDFEFWLRDYYEINRKDYNKYPFPVILKKYYRKTDIEKNALIIEWFDSVDIKIFITPTMYVDDWSSDVFAWTECLSLDCKTRTEATEKGIIKANEIYNNIK